MSEPSDEPEKYSIDEMMGRLRSHEPTEKDGELVTRADGTKALKVRKRKRRTDQSKKDKIAQQNQRVQLLQISGSLIVIVLLLIIVGLGILYTNSSSFRKGLLAKIEDISGSEVKVHQFRMTPATAHAQIINMLWSEGNVINQLDAYHATAKINPISFLGKEFNGEEVVATKGMLYLSPPVADKLVSKVNIPTSESVINFSRYSISNLNIFFDKTQSWDRMIEGTEISYFPILSKDQGEIRLNNGLLKFRNWPLLALDRAYINVSRDELHVENIRFEIPKVNNQRSLDKGSIDFSGILRPTESGMVQSLSASLDDFPISYLLGEDLGHFFRGEIITKQNSASNFLRFTPGSEEEALLELNFSNSLDSRIDLMQFNFIGQLALTLNDRWYELPSFQSEITGLLKRRGQHLELIGLHFDQRGKMALRGSISCAGASKKIAGKFRVGIPETLIAASGNRRLDILFGPVIENYRWVELELSGTCNAPVDNFKELYHAANPSGLIESKVILEQNSPDTFDQLIEGE